MADTVVGLVLVADGAGTAVLIAVACIAWAAKNRSNKW